MDEVIIKLTADEFDALLLALGYATGAAMKENRSLAYSFLRICNAVNRDNPHYIPYAIPEEDR